MSSLFQNYGRHLHDDSAITSGLAEYGREPTHPETGKLLRHCTALELEYVYKRFPTLPKVKAYDPEYRRPLDDCHTINGGPASLERKYQQLERNAALLKDPVARREPTKPVSVEQSYYRVAIHEISGHAFVAWALDIPIARVTVVPNGRQLGHVLPADVPDSRAKLAFYLSGECAEQLVFGNVFEPGVAGDRKVAKEIATRLAAKSGGNADQILADELECTLNMLRDELPVMRALGFELARHKTLEFEAIEAAIERCCMKVDARS